MPPDRIIITRRTFKPPEVFAPWQSSFLIPLEVRGVGAVRVVGDPSGSRLANTGVKK